MAVPESARLIGRVALSGAEPETGGAELDISIGEKDCGARAEDCRARDTLRRNGRWHDTVLMSLLESELKD
ncbi:hypothetical protein [Nonomuraea sp. B19D2]|uniref:hypothetical protein n=1 Tax=Nonomuraea sp. B19D2 TaxID=3159561 RepID=UPI0032DA7FFE